MDPMHQQQAQMVNMVYAGNLYLQTHALPPDSRKLLERYITGDGVIVGWGISREGQLGTGSQYNVITPLMIGGHDKPVRMACSGLSSIWAGMRNVVMTMGSGMWGELAVGNPRLSSRVVINDMNMPICRGQMDVVAFSKDLPEIMVDVDGGFSYFVCISARGWLHSWGANNYAQCHPDFARNPCCGFPQARRFPEKIVQVACANYAVIARALSGRVYGWGVTVLLGDEEDVRLELKKLNSAPVPVEQSHGRETATHAIPIVFFNDKSISLVRAGPWHFAAITREGNVYTWGLGNNGRLGHGESSDQQVPKLVAALFGKTVVEVACGSFHTVFVTADGEAYACGDNLGGQCGVEGEDWIGIPTRMHVTAGRPVIHASCGRIHTVLLLMTGEMVAYGTGPGLGVGAGYGIRLVRCQPVMETYTTLWMTSGPSHNFALTIPKTTIMLVLGVPHRGVHPGLTSVGLNEGIISCGVGCGFSIIVSRNGSCYSFGVGGWGQLGFDTSQVKEFTPERVPVVQHATRISYFSRTIITYVAAGFSFAIAITEGERVFAWGNNSKAQCGLGVDPKRHRRILQPREITWLADKEILQVSCGNYFGLALSSSGDVYSWGNIECCGHGLEPTPEAVPPNFIMHDMGSETRGVILSPTKILSLECIIQIAAGGWHAVALNAIGEIFVWGVSSGGRLGLGPDSGHMYVPVRLHSKSFFTRIGAGCYTSYAIDDDANLFLWGVNDKQQLGLRIATVDQPTKVLANVRDVCLGKHFTLAVTFAGTFHLSGVMEQDGMEPCISTSFYDVHCLPDMLKPSNLAAARYKGVRVYGGLEHVIVFVERDPIHSKLISEVTAGMRTIPEDIIARFRGS